MYPLSRTPRIGRAAAVALVAAVTLFAGTASRAQTGGAPAPARDAFTPLAASALRAPHPVPGADGNTHLAYELLLINPTPLAVTVERVEVLDGNRPGRVLADVSGVSLDSAMWSIGGVPGRTVGASQVFRVLLDVQIRRGAPVPRALVHRLTVILDPPTPLLPGRFLAARTAVAGDRPVVLGPPLRGPRWIQFSTCCDPRGAHRFAVSPVNGELHAAQRFAVDIVQLDTAGRLFTGPADQVTSFPYYGAPVLSVAAGRVVGIRDDMPDQIPFQPTPVVLADQAIGNHVVVDIGGGRFALFAHLKPGSVRVAVGQRVRAGQQLGQLGNSGNTDFPHLHFHVVDSPSPLGSDGLPYVLRSFDSPGSVPPIDQIDPFQPIPIGPQLRGHYEGVTPMIHQVVDYPPAT
jgi:hypothetical protein